jgi:ELWxxDGT repeat protein
MSSEPSQRRSSLLTGLFLALVTMPLCAALAPAESPSTPSMVADLNTQPVNGDAFPSPYYFPPPQMVALGSTVYFTATDPVHGLELWRSDGTPEGTRLVRDIRPGSGGANLQTLTVHQGRLYFYADDGVWGREIWTSDGTREGTRLLRDVCPGPCSISGRGSIASAGDRLYFMAGPFNGLELWRTDGTREGTRRVVDLCPPGCAFLPQGGLTGLDNGRVLFVADHPGTGAEIWGSDGTPEGTRPVDLTPGPLGSSIIDLNGVGDRGVFWRYGQGVHDLWASDGTPAGTRLVRAGLERPTFNTEPVVWRGSLYFVNFAHQFWRTDGTGAGTVLLRRFQEFGVLDVPFHPTRLTPLANSLLFIGGDLERHLALWRTRGTPATTRPLRDPEPGAGGLVITGLHHAGNRALFFTRTIEGQIDLWTSGDTASSTRRVTTVCPPEEGCTLIYRDGFLGAGGLSYFMMSSAAEGGELWRSDGTAAGTFRVRDIHRDPGSSLGTGSLSIDVLGADFQWTDFGNDLAPLDGRVLFGARTSDEAATLWSSDGTAAGTVQVSAATPWPHNFVRHGEHLFFTGALPWYEGARIHRRQGLWRTDGRAAGTEQLDENLQDLDLLASVGDFLFLRARDESAGEGTGIEPWRTDGTREGTLQIADIDQTREWLPNVSPPASVPASSHPGIPVRLGALLLFAADDGLTGRELWATDGTAAGTRQVRNVNLQDADEGGYVQPGSEPDSLVRLDGVVLFAADDGVSGRELWVTDGTEAGTRRLRDLRPGTEGSVPHDLVEHGGLVYFFASATGEGDALWRTDGTEAGTLPVKSLARRSLPSWGSRLTPVDGRLFFVAANEATGPELHVSDGTAPGTRMLQIRPGRQGAYPQSLTVMNGHLIFAADDGAHGFEPWKSDGTPAGTRPLGDLSPGQNASSPSSFTVSGGKLFFGADDGVHGRELWVVEGAR